MDYDKSKILKMVLTLAGICLLIWGVTQVNKQNSTTLYDYATEHPEVAYQTTPSPTVSSEAKETKPEDAPDVSTISTVSTLVGASLNSTLSEEIRLAEQVVYTEGFYYEPLSENLKRYITGISYPQVLTDTSEADTVEPNTGQNQTQTEPEISYDDLRYVHIWHYDFEGNPVEGELICHKTIAPDFVEIFYELYRNEYQIEQVHLIDEFNGNDTASMEANNTSCFNYRVVEGSTSLSKHAYGLAIDINPLYNPYVTYNKDGSENVSPAAGQAYADRTASFPYKIDENDLCYRLFMEHGFTWGGAWNSCKDYQHFQKPLPNK